MRANLEISRFSFEKTACVLLGIVFGIMLIILPIKMSILAVFGSIITVIILINTEIGLLLTIAAFPFEIAGNFKLAGANTAFQTISVVKILGVITALSWLIQLTKKRYKIVISPQLFVIIGLILTGIISIYFGTYHGEFYVKKAMKYLSMYIIYFAIFFMMTNIIKSKALIQKIIIVLIFIATISSLYSVVQRVVPRFRVEIKSKEDDYYRSHGAIVDPTEMSTIGFAVIRTSSIMAHPDGFALFLALTIPLTLYRFELSRDGPPKIGLFLILVIQFIGLTLTFCRGGTYTVFIIMMLMVIKRVIKPSWEKIFIVIAAFAMLSIFVLNSTTALNRLFDPGHVVKAYSFHGRLDLIRAGVRMFIGNNWLFGIGMGNYDYNLPLYSNIPFTYEPTNEYTRILSEMGLLGSFFSLALYLLTYTNFRAAEKLFKKYNDLPMYDLTNTLKACFLGFLFYGLTQVTLTRKELPIVMALAIVLKQLSNKLGAIKSKKPENLKLSTS